ncbi:MAG: hypothetical protein Q9170_003319 [Blastenia crenularia]
MANLDSATTGSLAEYDIILSISEEAINRQFELLYKKPIHTNKSLPPPPGTKLPSGAVTAPAQYLINHDLQIYRQYTNKAKQLAFDKKTGIFAHIKCPKISLQTNEANTASITFEFVRVEGAAVPDSEFRSWVGAPPEMEVVGQAINGWTMSWKVRIGEHKFGDINQELVQPAQDNSKPIVTHPNTVEALKAVDPREFTVASIFCIFEDGLIANSFTILDENGQKPNQNTNDFMLLISHYFNDLQQASENGAPTADHPYVLGYGLAQKVPDLKQVNPDAEADSTPKYFIPSGYQMTVTPGYTWSGAQRQDSKYTRGTLNFCLLTFREDNDPNPARKPEKTIVAQNANSGKLSQTLFDLTKTSENDGIMGFAQDLIWAKFFGPLLADAYHINMNDALKKLDSGSVSASNSSWASASIAASPPTYVRSSTVDLDGKKKHAVFDDKTKTHGESKTTISWTSDLQTNPDVEKKDAVRKIYLTVENTLKIDHTFVDVELLKDDTYEAHFDVAMKYVWEISAGKAGVIDIKKLDGESKVPATESDGKIKWITESRNGRYGAYMTQNNDKNTVLEFIKAIGSQGQSLLASLMIDLAQSSVAAGFASSLGETLGDNSKKDFDSIKNKVIMPAGNVFNYAGVDIDSQGNLFVHISFALGAEGVDQTKDAKNQTGMTG